MSEQLITSLALLKVNWDRGRDYIENFVPFVVECLRLAPTDEISLPQVQSAMRENFGLTIPQGALKTILKRASRRGYVTKTHGIFLRNTAVVGTFSLQAARGDVLRLQEAVVTKLVAFCEQRYKVSWSPEVAEVALLSYLRDRSTPILAAVVRGEDIPRPLAEVKHAEFLVNAFVANLHASDPEGFRFLETMVKGSILASVLLYPDISAVTQKFEDVEVYFDSRLIFRAIGLATPSLHVAGRELVDLTYTETARLRCFKHTFDEIWRILDASARALRNPAQIRRAYGEAVEYFVDANYSSSDVQLEMDKLEKKLESLHIQVRPKPGHAVHTGVNENRLESILSEEVGYHSREALLHDLDSLTAIHRLRRGEIPRRLETCRAVFLTSNNNLARASARFFQEEYGDEPGAIPLCMHDHTFSTLIWLKTPLKAPDLPTKRMIADCFAALNPSDALWKAYLQEIDRLQQRGNISEHD